LQRMVGDYHDAHSVDCNLVQRRQEDMRTRNSGTCQLGAQKITQCKAAITSALALRREFTVGEGNTIQVLERVEVFKYLGRLLAQDDDDVQAIRNQIRKARGHGRELAKY